MSRCQSCNRKLTTNEIGISLRLLGRNTQRLLCRECLAGELKVDPNLIDAKIEQFRQQGCTLFV